MRDAAEAKAALQGMADAVKAETAAEVAGSTQAAAARGKDITAIQQETQALQQLANAAKSTNTQLLYGGRNDMTQHLSDLAQELNYTTLLNRQKWLGFSSVQQAMSYRQQMYNLSLLENKAHFAGYLTADQYLGFLQREIAQTAALSAAIHSRTAAIGEETAALLAHANALHGTSQTAGSLGEQLTAASAYITALTGIPNTVRTRAVLDDSQALSQLAAYRAALLGLPHAEVTDIVSTATRLGGVPLTAQGEVLPVTVRPDIDFAAVNRMLAQAAALAAAQQKFREEMAAAANPAEMADAIAAYQEAKRAAETAAEAVTEVEALTRDLDVLEGKVVEPRLAIEGGPQALAETAALGEELRALPERKVLYVTADDGEAVDDFNFLDAMLNRFAREPARLRVDAGEVAQGVTEADLLANELDALRGHAARLGVDFSEVEAARLAAERLDEALRADDGEDVVIHVDSSGAVTSIEEITGAEEAANSELDRFLGDLAEASRRRYDFQVGLDDTAALGELDALEGRIVTAEEQGKALMALLGQGGASGGGGGGGPPVPPAGAAGGEPNPDDLNALRALEDELNKVANAQMAVGRTASTTADALAQVGKQAQLMVDPLVASTGGWFGLNSQLRLFGGLLPGALGTVSAWHVVLDFIIEGLAIFVPAILTAAAGLTAFGIAGIDAAQAVYNRLMALHTVLDATKQAIPPLTGNLENLHRVVRPEVWQLYGDAIDIASQKSGLFNQLAIETGHTVDRLAARLTVDLTNGSQGLATFFGIGAQDLAKLGTFFSNLGQALLSFIRVSQATHIDQIFLDIFVALSQLLVLVTKLPTPLLAAAVGLHAFWLWGGLLSTVILQLLNPLRALALALGAVDAAEVSGGLASLGKDASAFERLKAGFNDIAAGLAAIPGRFGLFSSAAKDAAASAGELTVATEDAGAAASTAAADGGGLAAVFARLAGSGGAVTAIAAIAVALAGAYTYLALLPDPTQKWIDSLNQALAKTTALTVVSQTVANLAAVTQELAKAQATGVGNVSELTGAQQGLNTELGNELVHVGQVSKAYGTDFLGALELLNTAGVKTSDIFSAQGKTWEADLQQVKGLVDGYKAMGQGLSALQQDVSVQLVTTSSQVTAMGKLNQAWDTWTGLVAAPINDILALSGTVTTFSTDAKAAGASMTGLASDVLGAGKSVKNTSVQLQTDFQSTFSSVQKLFDAMRNSEAVTGDGGFTQFVKDAVAALLPLADGNKAAAAEISALAQEAGGPATTSLADLAKWAGNVKNPMDALYAAAQQATIGTSNLSQDAARLTSTLQQDLNPAMAQAVFNAHGGQQTFNIFADNLAKFGPSSKQTVAAAQDVAATLLAVSGNSKNAKANFVGFAEAMGLNAKQADTLWAQATQHITANLGQMRKDLASAASSQANIVKPGETDTILKSFKDGTFYELTFLAWIPQVQRALNVVNHDVGQFFAHDIPVAFGVTSHAFESAWKGMVNWFTQSVPHGLQAAWKPVSSFFDKAFTHDIPSAWNRAWSGAVTPVVHAFDDVKNWVSSNFDKWWKTHGDSVKSVWHAIWGQIRSDALAAWHFIQSDAVFAWHVVETAAVTAWHAITSIFTSGAAKGFWNFISSGAVGAWQLAVSTAKASWTEIVSLAKAAWDILAAVARSVWAIVWQLVVDGAKAAADALVGVFRVAWAIVQAVAKVVWDAIVLIVDEVLNIITGHWQTAWKDLQSFGIQVWNAIRTAAIQVWNAISTAAVQIWNAIWSGIKAAGDQVWNALRTGGQQAWSAIWGALNSTFIGPMANFFGSTVPSWWNSLVGAASRAWSSVWSGFVNSVINPIVNFFGSTLPNAIARGVSNALNALAGPINSILGTVKSALSFIPGLAAGGPVRTAAGHAVRMASGSVPGTGDEDGTHIVAMGGEYVVRKPARMALQAAYGPDFLDWLNYADVWLRAGSRGNAASQKRTRGYAAAGGEVMPAVQMSFARTLGPAFAGGGEVPGLSGVASMFGGGMAAGGVVPNLFVPGLSANLSRQLSAATAGQLPRTLSQASGSRTGLRVDNLTINNPVREKPSESITRASNRLAFLAGREMV